MTADYPVATAGIEQRQEEIEVLIEAHRHAEELCSKNGISFDVDHLYDDIFIPGTIVPSSRAAFLP